MDQRAATVLAISLAGGQAAVARALNIRQPSVHMWAATGRVPAERVLALVELCGGKVSERELRPDVFGTGVSVEGEA